MQKSNPLPDGCSASDFQKKAFAFVQYIMPNLAQKFEPHDAAEYILKLMPAGLHEAGQRIKFQTKSAGRFTDLMYLIRLCGSEVFEKQRAAAPAPTFAAVEQLGGYEPQLIGAAVGVDDLRVEGAPPGSMAFAFANKKWCPKCPQPGGTCI